MNEISLEVVMKWKRVIFHQNVTILTLVTHNIYTLAPSMQFPSPKVDLTTKVLPL